MIGRRGFFLGLMGAVLPLHIFFRAPGKSGCVWNCPHRVMFSPCQCVSEQPWRIVALRPDRFNVTVPWPKALTQHQSVSP